MAAIFRKAGVAAVAAVVAAVLIGSGAADAATVGSVTFGSGISSTLGTGIINSLDTIASMIRYIMGSTALIVIVAAAAYMHFIHNPRSKETAKELLFGAIIGLLLAAFAPQIVNFITSL
jgi:hypothetical protein